ncbi:MAG TPA: ankyrin repeat domain-containing protein [Abditibacterium sp.]
MNVNEALGIAVRSGNLELMEAVLAAGTDPLTSTDRAIVGSFNVSPPLRVGSMDLISAIAATRDREITQDHLQIVRWLLDLGVNVNSKRQLDAESYPLHEAIHTKHEALIRLLLERGATLFTSGGEAAGLIRWAANYGLHWFVVLFLERQRDVIPDAEVKRGLEEALCKAARGGYLEIVQLLLDHGVPVDARDWTMGRTALMNAASSGHEAIVNLLRSRGADIYARSTRGADIQGRSKLGTSVFFCAAQGGLTDLSLELLENGADVAERNFYNDRPLNSAAARGNEILTRQIVNQGAGVRARDDGNHSVLQNAAYGGNHWLIETCLKAGEPVDVQDDWGYTPLMWAAKAGNLETLRLLVERGAKVNHVARNQGETALHYAIYGKQLEAARWLIENGADIEAKMDDLGEGELLPLMNAIESEQHDMVEMLLHAGADVNARNSQGNTALHHAASGNSLVFVEFLVRAGANINAREEEMGRTPLIEAALYGKTEIASYLLKAGADIEICDESGETALHKSVHNEQIEMASLLLNAGAYRNAQNLNGQTPFDLSVVNPISKVRKLLEKPNGA